MPLLPGKANIGKNITELREHGSRPRSERQILAIALSEASRRPRADGGSTYADIFPREPWPAENRSAAISSAVRIAHRDMGGIAPQIPYFERQEARDITASPYGFSAGIGSGRTDKNAVSVGAGSYVLPSDIVAGLGDGNSLAGAHIFDQIMKSMPWGISPERSQGHRGPPQPPHDPALMAGITGGQREPPINPALADGGEAPEADKVPILSADGEYTLSPEDVLRVGQFYSRDSERASYPKSHARMMKRGHTILDAFVKQTRGATIKHLKGLRGPVGSKDANKGHV